jgi:GST-like protein
MIDVHFYPSPNGLKIPMMLEECGLPYRIVEVNILRGAQFAPEFLRISPNNRIPAIVDHDAPGGPLSIFESGAILQYLAEKFGGALLPAVGTAQRAECLSWLFWQMGAAPYLGGGFGHFYAYAPIKIEYAIDRYAMEVKRQLDVLDRRLSESAYLAGDAYTIADIAVWPWYGALAKGLLYESGEFLQVQEYKHVQRWTEAIAERAAVKRGRMVNRTWGQPSSQLHERHEPSDFETKTQDKVAPRADSAPPRS